MDPVRLGRIPSGEGPFWPVPGRTGACIISLVKRALLSLVAAAAALPAHSQAPALLPVLRPAFRAAPASVAGTPVPLPPAPAAKRSFLSLAPSSPAREPRERAFFDAVLAALDSTREGRKILDELEAGGRPIQVSFAPMADSSISLEQGQEWLDGTGGSWDRNGGLKLNELFLEMRDQAPARTAAAGVLGHELEHARLQAAARLLGAGYETILSIDAANERNAFLSGYLVAAELGAETRDLRSARGLVSDSADFWERKRLVEPLYALALTLDEMSDPVAAWTKRAAALREKLAAGREQLAEGIPWTLKALAHMERAHGLQVKHLRDEVETDRAAMAVTVRERQETLDFLESRMAMFAAPAKRAELVGALTTAAANPGYQAFTRLVEEKTAKLAGILPPAPPAPAAPAPSGKMTWDRFYEHLEDDRQAHPEHWDPVSRDPIGLGPSWKPVLADLGDPRG